MPRTTCTAALAAAPLARRAGCALAGALLAAGVLGCGPGHSQSVGTGPMPIDVSGPPPVPGVALNASYVANAGLLTKLDAQGTPITSGDSDPMILETLRFYDTLQSPLPDPVAVDYADPFTGAPPSPHRTAPLTIDDWKRTFGMAVSAANDQGQDQDLQTFRDREGITVYYNRNELALGRELGCGRFVDGHDANGAEILGIACYVTNYGNGFRQGHAALAATIAGQAVRNTVCISYRPTLDPGYQVQFYVYGADGKRQSWAKLDTLGPRPHPQVCTTCHGGEYDPARHLVKNAHFLPLDPNVVVFAQNGEAPAGTTRAGQEERVRAFNAMATETPLTSAQQTMLNRLYPNGVTTQGSTASGDGVPDAWRTNAADSDFYRVVIKPYCATCHLAGERGLGDSTFWPYAMFDSPAAFNAAPLEAHVCNAFSMPNAQPTSLGFWDAEGNPGVSIAGQMFPAAADALLARRGLNRTTCSALASLTGCNRGPDPDALCGGAVSGGATCDLPTGRCVPVTMP